MQSKQKFSLVIFGATGRTGRHCIKMALDKGHSVIAVARDPSSISITHPLLKVVKADVMKVETFTEALKGAEVIISCIGATNLKPTTLFSTGVSNIIKAMRQNNIHRILCMSASGIELNPRLPVFYRFISKYIVQKLFRNPYKDTRLMEQILKDSNLEWTSVRPPMLTNKPGAGTYRFAANTWLDRCIKISRMDVASFIIDNIDSRNTFRAVVEVAE